MIVNQIVDLINDKFQKADINLERRDIMNVARLGKKPGTRPRPVKVVLQSVWVKRTCSNIVVNYKVLTTISKRI